jgi:hypothetical protein
VNRVPEEILRAMAAQTPTIQTENLLREISSFRLLDAIFGRRARRFGLGMTIPDGPLAYRSSEPPVPLSEIERMLLVLCGTGISGWNTGIEHTTAGQPDTGCNYPMRLLGRTFPSGASIYASELIFTDDEGTYLTRLRDLDPQTLLEGQPAISESARRAGETALRPAFPRTSHGSARSPSHQRAQCMERQQARNNAVCPGHRSGPTDDGFDGGLFGHGVHAV